MPTNFPEAREKNVEEILEKGVPTITSELSRSGLKPNERFRRQFRNYNRPGTGDEDPVLAFVFDDSWEDTYTHRDVFKDNNAELGNAIITQEVGSADKLTWDQIDEMAKDEGILEVIAHSRTHDYDPWNNRNVEKMYDEAHGCFHDFLERGYQPNIWVPPGSNDGGALGRSIISEIYIKEPWTDPDWDTKSPKVKEELNNSYPFRIYRYRIQGGQSISSIESLIDDAVGNDLSLILYGHHIIDGTTDDEDTGEVSTGKIDKLITYARNNGMKTGTPTEAMFQKPIPLNFPAYQPAMKHYLTGETEIWDHGTGKLLNVRTESGGSGYKILSEIIDDTEDDIRWDRDFEGPYALRVYNEDTYSDLLEVHDNGDVESGGNFVVGNALDYNGNPGFAIEFNKFVTHATGYDYDNKAIGWNSDYDSLVMNSYSRGEKPIAEDGGIQDLSGTTGEYDGQQKLDDGTNTAHRGTICVWDDVNSVWVKPDGTTFS